MSLTKRPLARMVRFLAMWMGRAETTPLMQVGEEGHVAWSLVASVKEEGRTDYVVHSFYILPIYSLPSPLLMSPYPILSISLLAFVLLPSPLMSPASALLLRRWRAVPPPPFLPPSLPHPLRPPRLYATGVGRRQWLVASDVPPFLRTLSPSLCDLHASREEDDSTAPTR